MSDKYILEGHTPVPCESVMAWGRWFGSSGKLRVVGSTELDGGVRVSTVFLGLNHGFGSGVPLLFETMVFEGPLDSEQARYETWADAEAGHAAMVERAKAAHVDARVEQSQEPKT